MVRLAEIDRPFRFTWDFCVVWLLLFVVALYALPASKDARSYEHPLASLLFSLFATFLIYGPVLLARQIVRSGSRGRFVGRAFVSVLFLLLIAAGILHFTPYTPVRGHLFALVAAIVSTVYLQWRLH